MNSGLDPPPAHTWRRCHAGEGAAALLQVGTDKKKKIHHWRADYPLTKPSDGGPVVGTVAGGRHCRCFTSSLGSPVLLWTASPLPRDTLLPLPPPAAPHAPHACHTTFTFRCATPARHANTAPACAHACHARSHAPACYLPRTATASAAHCRRHHARLPGLPTPPRRYCRARRFTARMPPA